MGRLYAPAALGWALPQEPTSEAVPGVRTSEAWPGQGKRSPGRPWPRCCALVALGCPAPRDRARRRAQARSPSPDTSSGGAPGASVGGRTAPPSPAEQQDRAGRSQWRPGESMTSLCSVLGRTRCEAGVRLGSAALEDARCLLPVPAPLSRPYLHQLVTARDCNKLPADSVFWAGAGPEFVP